MSQQWTIFLHLTLSQPLWSHQPSARLPSLDSWIFPVVFLFPTISPSNFAFETVHGDCCLSVGIANKKYSYRTPHHCFAVLIHALHQPHILLCHSWFFHSVLQFLSWQSITCFLYIEKATVQYSFWPSLYSQSKHQCSFSTRCHPAAHWSSTLLLNLASTTLSHNFMQCWWLLINSW